MSVQINRLTVSAAFLLILMILSLRPASAFTLKVQDFCGLSETGTLGVNLGIELVISSKGVSLPQHIHISCSKEECSGFRANGNYWGSETMEGIRIKSITPNKAVLIWGLSEFTLDKTSKRFFWKTTDGGYGVADCPSILE